MYDQNESGLLKKEVEQTDNNNALLPIMSLMLILIPLLVGNVAFYHLKSIAVTTPGQAPDEPQQAQKPEKTRKVMVQLKIDNRELVVDLIDEDSGDSLQNHTYKGTQERRDLETKLNTWKSKYPKLDTALVSSAKTVNYDRFVAVLDSFKTVQVDEKPAINVVLIPDGAM